MILDSGLLFRATLYIRTFGFTGFYLYVAHLRSRSSVKSCWYVSRLKKLAWRWKAGRTWTKRLTNRRTDERGVKRKNAQIRWSRTGYARQSGLPMSAIKVMANIDIVDCLFFRRQSTNVTDRIAHSLRTRRTYRTLRRVSADKWPLSVASGAGTNLKVGQVPVRSESGGPERKKILVVPLHSLALKAQLVVLASAFVVVSAVWSVCCLLFFYSRFRPCPVIVKVWVHALVPHGVGATVCRLPYRVHGWCIVTEVQS